MVSVRDARGASEQRFAASPAYAREVQAFEGEVRGVRSALPDGADASGVVAVTEAVLRAVQERRVVSVTMT